MNRREFILLLMTVALPGCRTPAASGFRMEALNPPGSLTNLVEVADGIEQTPDRQLNLNSNMVFKADFDRVAEAGRSVAEESLVNVDSAFTGDSLPLVAPDPATPHQMESFTGAAESPIQPVNWSVFEEPPPASCDSPDDQPGCPFWRNLRHLGPTVWEDTRGLIQPENALILGLSLAAAIGIHQDLDDQVREATDDNPTRWGTASRVLGYLGEAQYQVPFLIAISGYGVHAHDDDVYGFSESLISAYTINGLATLAIKGIADTDRPDADWNGGSWGFPSFHAASAFTIAAVVEEYYGWGAGLPAYTLAGLISWSRIDERDHDLSDVVFGAAMGWVIGKSVASQHLYGDGRVQIYPWRHPSEGAVGMAVETRF